MLWRRPLLLWRRPLLLWRRPLLLWRRPLLLWRSPLRRWSLGRWLRWRFTLFGHWSGERCGRSGRLGTKARAAPASGAQVSEAFRAGTATTHVRPPAVLWTTVEHSLQVLELVAFAAVLCLQLSYGSSDTTLFCEFQAQRTKDCVPILAREK